MGTLIYATVNRVVDGDTIRVFLPGAGDDESLRILALDTEESNAGSSKPVTPWGHKAKERANAFFNEGDTVQLEFPGNETLDICLKKYRGNFGRLLVFIYKNDLDFQEVMIRDGFSPYFMKYGNAALPVNHRNYVVAERQAQRDHVGVWDQIKVNGSEVRNYAALGTWWRLRANIIDQYRIISAANDNLLNSRLDFDEIRTRAETEQQAMIFTELRELTRIGARSAIIKIGSIHQPFSIFLPDIESVIGQEIIQLLQTRYISADVTHPRRSYSYVTGRLKLFQGNPEIVVTSPNQIQDDV